MFAFSARHNAEVANEGFAMVTHLDDETKEQRPTSSSRTGASLKQTAVDENDLALRPDLPVMYQTGFLFQSFHNIPFKP